VTHPEETYPLGNPLSAATMALDDSLGHVSKTRVSDTPRKAPVTSPHRFREGDRGQSPVCSFRAGCVINPRQIAVTAIETAALLESLGVSETLVFDTLKCLNLNKTAHFSLTP